MNVYSIVWMGNIIRMFTSKKRAISFAKSFIFHNFDDEEKVWKTFVKEGYEYITAHEKFFIRTDLVDIGKEELVF